MAGEPKRTFSESNTTTSKQEMKTMLEELQAEFDAFRESSAELECELERELERVEARARKSEEELRRNEDSSKEVTARLTREVCKGSGGRIARGTGWGTDSIVPLLCDCIFCVGS